MQEHTTTDASTSGSDDWRSARIASTATRHRRPSWRSHVGNLVFVLAFVGGNVAIGYIGWTIWRSNQPSPAMTAPLPVDARPPGRSPSTSQRNPRPTVSRESPATPQGHEAADAGTMRWTRRDGLTIEPDAEWRCVGGFQYRTTRDGDGTTVVTLRQRGGKPLPC